VQEAARKETAAPRGGAGKGLPKPSLPAGKVVKKAVKAAKALAERTRRKAAKG
jgi:hypothetical protein